ncbi:hypothetical protein STSP2_01192 [Anaerohalosphaera lusitana]|uniref:Uncharacterized protein n=1 Tax=Anaerohalosphaera lusitana TaxID=1936003 RepID=A0A1U9NJW7_9BACT|nr:hypothetical protein STSP2_01192 [Anaerohalosphaera lusitana]
MSVYCRVIKLTRLVAKIFANMFWAGGQAERGAGRERFRDLHKFL